MSARQVAATEPECQQSALELTDRARSWQGTTELVDMLNRALRGWANCNARNRTPGIASERRLSEPTAAVRPYREQCRLVPLCRHWLEPSLASLQGAEAVVPTSHKWCPRFSCWSFDRSGERGDAKSIPRLFAKGFLCRSCAAANASRSISPDLKKSRKLSPL